MAWSQGFHVALRREWALGLALNQHGSHGSARVGGLARLERTMRDPLWYFPASERPAWTAWSAVVELSLRNMARAPRAGVGDPHAEFETEATHDVLPTVMVPCAGRSGPPSWVALTIKMHGLGRSDQATKGIGYPTRRMTWHFSPEALPWTASQNEGSGNMSGISRGAAIRQPDAAWIWQWALGHASCDEAEFKRNLGMDEMEARA